MFARSVTFLAFAAGVFAQTTNTTIDPSSVSLTLRSQWCEAETNTCGTLCSGDYANNTCSPDTLAYSCTCAANNSAPGLQYYKETMPTFICEQVFTNCIAANAGDAAAQNLCNTNEQNNCGHLDPANFTAAVTTTSASSSATTSASAASGSATSTSTSKGAGATMAAMRNLGTGAFAVGVGAAFGYMI
ncbi:hypothetical protein BDZ45DRAFT_726220 [Acephala macrosclerotiorum]|nr:hypothetical protein BDZ45DRAFT_726220 [Acephala macrosclerotiorum]